MGPAGTPATGGSREAVTVVTMIVNKNGSLVKQVWHYKEGTLGNILNGGVHQVKKKTKKNVFSFSRRYAKALTVCTSTADAYVHDDAIHLSVSKMKFWQVCLPHQSWIDLMNMSRLLVCFTCWSLAALKSQTKRVWLVLYKLVPVEH